MKSKTKLFTVTLLASALLVGCGGNGSTEEVVTDFYKTFQDGDFEKLDAYVRGGVGTTEDAESTEYYLMLLRSSSERIDFGDAVEVSNDGDTAEVQIEVESMDVFHARKETVDELLPLVGTLDFTDDDDILQGYVNGMSDSILVEKLAEAPLVKNEVTLQLELDENGNYMIIPNEDLFESLLPNFSDEF